ncbi:MAG: energy transducer TonB [Acidobacteriota bacterium]|nr:energy transducer TonB [Acidobacteriota bacterium]
MSVSESGLSEPVSRVPRRTPLTVRFSPEFMSGLSGDIRAEQTPNKPQADSLGLLFGRVYDDVVIVSACKLLKGEESKTNSFPVGLLATLKANLPSTSADLIGWCRIGVNSDLVESDFDFHNRCFRRASDIAVLLKPRGSAGVSDEIISAEIYAKSLKAKLSNENCCHSTQCLSAISSSDTPVEANLRRPIDPSIYLRAYEATDGFAPSKGSLSTLATFVRSAVRFGRSGPVHRFRFDRDGLLEAASGSRKWNLFRLAVPAAIAGGALVGIVLGVKFRSGGPFEVRPSQTSDAVPVIAHPKSEQVAGRAAAKPVVAEAVTKTDASRGADLITRPLPVNREIAKQQSLSRTTEMVKERSAIPPPRAVKEAATPEPERTGTVFTPLASSPVSVNPTLARVATAQPSQLKRSTASGNTLPTAVPAPAPQTESIQKAEPPAAPSAKPSATPSPGAVLGEAYLPPRPLRQVVPATRGSGLMIFKEMAVEIQATVNAQGRVVATQPIQGPNKVSQQVIGAAIKAAEDWRFQPATLRGKPVESKYTIVFRFIP